ncbi:MAG: hypothetical protein IPF41_00430 [Flavobacteriales bacterium]|nr:hypothetical protein [Flavobacteriales bacterium]
MNTEALTLMLIAVCSVTAITVYFFFRVLTAPPKPEPDNYAENDDDPR